LQALQAPVEFLDLLGLHSTSLCSKFSMSFPSSLREV
jgi:hypothetical protein